MVRKNYRMLPCANLRRARLVNTCLYGADLNSADLRDAALNNADLRGADLNNADIRDADFSGAAIDGKTIFNDVTVNTRTKGLGPWIFNPDKYILREIEFSPEYRQAGLGIMHYFAEVMQQKYPDIPATVQITQQNLTVRMIIETDDGYRDIVEQTLEDYGLVISGKRHTAELFDDAVAMMRLENKLDVVRIELRAERRANRLLARYGSEQKARIEHLETEVSELRQIVGNLLAGMQEATHRAQQTTHLLAAGAVNHCQALSVLFARHLDRAPDNPLRQAIGTIQALAERALTATDQDALSGVDKVALTQAATDIEAADSMYWRDFKAELIGFFRGVGAGVGGNVATGILELLSIL